jgi:hypothetical protein
MEEIRKAKKPKGMDLENFIANIKAVKKVSGKGKTN